MTEITKLIDYHLWATGLTTRQVLMLPEEKVSKEIGGGFASIRLTLEHLLSADYLWMNRFKGMPHAGVPAVWGTLAELVATWQDVQKQLKESALVIAQRPEKDFKFTRARASPTPFRFSTSSCKSPTTAPTTAGRSPT
jgi:uncharacterized damage-inducible protein DinB